MELKYKIFPYPVIANYLNDYKNAKFEVEITVNRDGKNVEFVISDKLENEEIDKMIKNGLLKMVSHFECSKTGYRKVFDIRDNNKVIIHESQLNGKLQICTFVITANKINGYTNKDFHDDFRGMKFDFEAGSILGIANQIDFNVEKNKDDLKNTESIFSIQKNMDSNENNMLIDINMNKICIKLPEETYSIYKNLSSQFELRNLLNSIVILPALIFVFAELSKIDENERYESYSTYGWYKSLRKTIKESFDIEIESIEFNNQNIIELSQKLIDSPITDGFKVLYNSQSDIEEVE